MADFCFSDAAFTYLLSGKRDDRFSCAEEVCLGRSLLQHTDSTRCEIVRKGDRELCVVGLCVDSLGEVERADIPHYLLDRCCDSIGSLLEEEPRFAGRYVMLLTIGEQSWMLNDASSCLPVVYSTGGERCAASLDMLLGTHLSLSRNADAADIRSGGAPSQPLPYDLTRFDGARFLLPNHVLCLTTGEVTRFSSVPPKFPSTDALLTDSADHIDRILRAYAKEYRLICPLTGGWDSRTNLSFLLRNGMNIDTYTFYHPNFSDTTSDIAVPKQICDDFQLPHRYIRDITPDEKTLSAARVVLGEDADKRTLSLAYTYRSQYGPETALLAGDIIGQMGKHLFGNRLPAWLATSGFLSCKLHNASPKVRRYVRAQLSEYRSTGCSEQAFDLFALESRLGRWASQIQGIYAVCSVNSLNIFNCRSVIAAWMTLPGKFRVAYGVHLFFLRRNAPGLLKYPFNASSRLNFLKKSPILYYLATIGKHTVFLFRAKRKPRNSF